MTEDDAGNAAPEDISFTVERGIARVLIDRPARRNAMRLSMWRAMKDVFDRLGADPDIRAIVLAGAGADFCVGADVAEFAGVRADAEQSKSYEREVDACSAAIASVPKPTIAAVSGYCLGGGCHLALACDLRVADDTAVIGIPAARLSIVYGVASSRRLLNLVGLANAKRMLFSAKPVTAREGLRIGLVDTLHPVASDGAMELAAEFGGNAPLSLAGSKFILDGLAGGPAGLDDAAAQRLIDAASDSADFREAVAAFAQKRPAVFRGR